MGQRDGGLIACEDVLDRVYPLLLRTLAPVERDHVLAHVAGCESCRLLVEATTGRLGKILDVAGPERERARSRKWLRPWLWLLPLIPAIIAWGLMIRLGERVARYRYEHRFVARLEKALLAYRDDFGRFPPADGTPLTIYLGTRSRQGPYLDLTTERLDGAGHFIDHWGGRYRYRVPGTHNVRLFDLHADGENGRDDAGGGDDVTNWDSGFQRIPPQPR